MNTYYSIIGDDGEDLKDFYLTDLPKKQAIETLKKLESSRYSIREWLQDEYFGEWFCSEYWNGQEFLDQNL